MVRTVKDIDISKIDLIKHTYILKAGTELSRVIIGNFNPSISTGQENRYAKNPYNVSIDQFQDAFYKGTAVACGTSNVCLSVQLVTALRGVYKKYGNLESAVVYKVTFFKDISVIDTISLCLSEGVEPTPKEDVDFWHGFYGPPIRAQALRCRSAQDSDGENIILFPENIPDYINCITCKKYSKKEVGPIIKQIKT